MANISTFINSFRDTELARPTNFNVVIPIPFGLSTIFSATDLSLRCDSAQLPTRTFSLVEQKTYGPVRFFPVQNAYENVTLSFICSDNMIEKSFFDNWMNIISVSTRTVTNTMRNRAYFDFEYKDSYAVPIIITQQNLSGGDSYKVSLMEAFPISVNQMDLNWSSIDMVHKLSVTFNYRYFERIPLKPTDII